MPDEQPAGGGAGVLLARAANALARRTRAALKPHGLSAAQYLLLAGLESPRDGVPGGRPAGRSQVRLAARLGMDRAMASTVLAQLERRRLIARPPAADRRARAPALTRAGRARLAAARPAVEAAEVGFLAALRSELPGFAVMLRILLGERPRLRASAVRG